MEVVGRKSVSVESFLVAGYFALDRVTLHE